MGYMTQSGQSLSDLRIANLHRLQFFHNKHGELTHPEGVKGWTPAEWLEALVGEMGELSNVIKKVRRGDLKIEDVKKDIEDEFADIMTYLDLWAASLDVDLSKATINKWNEVSDRQDIPLHLKNRDGEYGWTDEAFKDDGTGRMMLEEKWMRK